MKRSILLLALFAMLSAPAISQVFTSDFETWTGDTPPKPSGWWGIKTSFVSADSTSQYTTSVHGGTYACKLRSRTTSHKRLTTQGVSVVASTTYNITFWVRGHGLIRTGYYKGAGSAGTQYVYNVYDTINSSTWTQITKSITPDTTSATAEIIFSVKSTAADLDDIQIDDVSVTEGSTSTVSIYDIQYTTTSPYNSPYNNQTVITGGIVTGTYNTGFFMQSGSGLYNGLQVFDSVTAANVDRGDSIIITGMITEFYNLTEMKNIVDYTVVSSGNAEPAPYAVTGANSKTEGVEGVLVKITDAPCVLAPNTYGEWALFDSDSTFVDNLMYSYTPVVGTHYDVTGPVTYSFGQFFIEPREAVDVQIHSGIAEIGNFNFSVYPNPSADMIYIDNANGVNLVKITNLIGQNIMQVPVSASNTTINISKLPKGIYFISLLNENETISTKKFVKE